MIQALAHIKYSPPTTIVYLQGRFHLHCRLSNHLVRRLVVHRLDRSTVEGLILKKKCF